MLARMERRALLRVLAGSLAVAGWPARVVAAPPRVVWFSSGNEASAGAFLQALRDELRSLGYQEGRDVVIETRWLDYRTDREQEIAAEIQATRPAVIVSQARAARRDAIVIVSWYPPLSVLATPVDSL